MAESLQHLMLTRFKHKSHLGRPADLSFEVLTVRQQSLSPVATTSSILTAQLKRNSLRTGEPANSGFSRTQLPFVSQALQTSTGRMYFKK